MAQEVQQGDALLIVDVQNDFIPGGALPVPDGDEIVPVLNEWIAAAREANVPVYASRDWHPFNHVSFEDEGGPWPAHCVRETPGAAFVADLDLEEDVTVLSKAEKPDKEAYSAFDGTGLAGRLETSGVKRLWVGGLALDYCVRASVLDAVKSGVETHLILPATRAIEEETAKKAIGEMEAAGAVIERESRPYARAGAKS
ncbi:MAG TPA: nicotinamidase [Rhodothermales bacterium]|nr:nicotinamidase [Rhodothermales bacterium]